MTRVRGNTKHRPPDEPVNDPSVTPQTPAPRKARAPKPASVAVEPVTPAVTPLDAAIIETIDMICPEDHELIAEWNGYVKSFALNTVTGELTAHIIVNAGDKYKAMPVTDYPGRQLHFTAARKLSRREVEAAEAETDTEPEPTFVDWGTSDD